MTEDEEVLDSPTGWVAEHIRHYVETEGRQGHRRWGVTTLLLTTRGRKSGKLRRTALIYGLDGGRYIVVGSNGGSPHHPSWYLNLLANPEVRVQVGAERFIATARSATGDERARLWQLMTSLWPDYGRYQSRSTRQIPVVILQPITAPGPPPPR
ncbi:nitroreductase family deazaflavin-dependent oxidoreductase [Micromonospora coxensis]|uniref:Deazaflavin-dependent oxidoreductase, nitroreductase family n=1 Tax=Micromonospora coxensis TaxID=356852 RepID=A0A1C5IZ69_9ACTN|nr:nitroreductase family deazaflavin-dependent oxidoreductase [Micromonospora coxensis]SCG63647.1 deazaflavin-dependent oxidoreductase, nitroreductase family [Micromonospora coxensis]